MIAPRTMTLLAFASALALLGVSGASAQNYPTQTIRIVVPQSPGGLIDTTARLIQPHLERSLKQTVIVENRTGAAGVLGTDAVAKAAPDGHTLLVVAGSLSVLPATNPNLPYDTERDLAPVALLSKYAFLFVVNSQVPAKTLPEFVALAKKDPGKYNYATTGMAALNHLATERLAALAGIKLLHIPYRGGAPSVMAVVKGEAHLLAISPQVTMPHIEAGSIRAIATGGASRDKLLPNVPTVAEAGYPGYEAVSWVGLLAPGKTPKPIVDRINAAVNEAMRVPEVADRIAKTGSEVGGGTPEAFRAMISREIKEWTEVARAANITTK